MGLLRRVKIHSPRQEIMDSAHLDWLRGERDQLADVISHTRDEVKSVLAQLDELAELWGDEGKFRRCRDRLRKLVNKV